MAIGIYCSYFSFYKLPIVFVISNAVRNPIVNSKPWDSSSLPSSGMTQYSKKMNLILI